MFNMPVVLSSQLPANRKVVQTALRIARCVQNAKGLCRTDYNRWKGKRRSPAQKLEEIELVMVEVDALIEKLISLANDRYSDELAQVIAAWTQLPERIREEVYRLVAPCLGTLDDYGDPFTGRDGIEGQIVDLEKQRSSLERQIQHLDEEHARLTEKLAAAQCVVAAA